jgi:hypothetical protein
MALLPAQFFNAHLASILTKTLVGHGDQTGLASWVRTQHSLIFGIQQPPAWHDASPAGVSIIDFFQGHGAPHVRRQRNHARRVPLRYAKQQ